MSLSFDIEVVDSRRSSMTQYGEGLGGDDGDLLEEANGLLEEANGLLDRPTEGFRPVAGGVPTVQRAIGGIPPAAPFTQHNSGALDAQDEPDAYGDYDDPFEQSEDPAGQSLSPQGGEREPLVFGGGQSSIAAASSKTTNEHYTADTDLQMASFIDTPAGPGSQSRKESTAPAPAAPAAVVCRTSLESCSSSDSESVGDGTAARTASAAKMALAARRTESPPPRREVDNEPYIPIFSTHKPRSHSIINKDLIPSMSFSPDPVQAIPEASVPIAPDPDVSPSSPPPVDVPDISPEGDSGPSESPTPAGHAGDRTLDQEADADDPDPYDFDFSTDLADIPARQEVNTAPLAAPAPPSHPSEVLSRKVTEGDSPSPRVNSAAEAEWPDDGATREQEAEEQDLYDFDFSKDLRVSPPVGDDPGAGGSTVDPSSPTDGVSPPAAQDTVVSNNEDGEPDPYDFDFSVDLGDAVVGSEPTAPEQVHVPHAEPPVLDDSADFSCASSAAPLHTTGSEKHLPDGDAEDTSVLEPNTPLAEPLQPEVEAAAGPSDAVDADETAALLRPTTSTSANGATGQSKYEYSYEDEFEDDWEDDPEEDDAGSSNDEEPADADSNGEEVTENNTGNAPPAAEQGDQGACVAPEEIRDPVMTKPRSADQSSSEFRFSQRFLDKKKELDNARAKPQIQTERRKSEGHKHDKRKNSSGETAPKKHAIPKKMSRGGSGGRVQSRGSSGKSDQRNKQIRLLREGKEVYAKLPLEQKNDRDDFVRRKLLHDIEEAKRAYLKECVEAGMPADGKILLSLEDLTSSDRRAYAPDVRPEKPQYRPAKENPPVDSPRRGRSLKPPVPRPPWGGHKPRVVLGAGGQPLLAPSRSVAVPSVRSSPMKAQLSSEVESTSNAHVDTVTFKGTHASSEKVTYNGFGEVLEEQPPKKKGGWPSPRYKATGTPKPGQANANRFIVAPSTFIKAPKQEKHLVDFYAAPIKFPIFRAAAPRRELSPDAHKRNIVFGTRPVVASGPTMSISPERSPAQAPDSYPSPPSPIKAKIAAAVASATAAAQNATASDAPLDVDALMRSLAALGNEIQPSPKSKSPNKSRAEQHAEKMKQLLHILNPHLEEAYVALIEESDALNEESEVPKTNPTPPPKPLSKKEQKELAVQARLEKMAKQFLTEKEYEERQKRKAEQQEKRAAFFENLEAKKKIEQENKKKEAARETHMRKAKKLLQEAVDKMPIEDTGARESAEAQTSEPQGVVSNSSQGSAKSTACGKPRDEGRSKATKNDKNDLILAVEAATATVTEDLHTASYHQQLNEKMLEQQLIRQKLLYEEEMQKQKEIIEQQLREKEYLQAQLQHQRPRESVSQEDGSGAPGEGDRDSSTAGQPTVIMMTKLSPRKDKIVATQVESMSGTYDDDPVPESPVSPGKSSTGVISFVEMDRSPSEREVRSDGTGQRGGPRRKIHVKDKNSRPAESEKYMDGVGQMVIHQRKDPTVRVVKELPKPHGPSQRAASTMNALESAVVHQPTSNITVRGEHDDIGASPAERSDKVRSNQSEDGPKMYHQYKTVAVPPAEPQPSSQRGVNSASRKVVQGGANSRGSSAINMSDFYEQIALTASQQLPMDSKRKRKNDDKSDSPRLPTVSSAENNTNKKESTTAKKRRNKEEEEEEYNRYYSDIFEEFKQSYN